MDAEDKALVRLADLQRDQEVLELPLDDRAVLSAYHLIKALRDLTDRELRVAYAGGGMLHVIVEGETQQLWVIDPDGRHRLLTRTQGAYQS